MNYHVSKKIGFIFIVILFALFAAGIRYYSKNKLEQDNSVQSNSRKFGTIEIIDPASLLVLINEVSVIDARLSGFHEGHISSSQPMNWTEWTEEKPSIINSVIGNPSRWGKVETNRQIEERLQNLGLSHEKLIVVVGSPSGWGEEGRIAWNLLFWGAQKVALLNGGFLAWKQMGYDVEYGEPSKIKEKGNFILSIENSRRATLEAVKQHLTSEAGPLFDSRTEQEFQGERLHGQRRGGRIPGAKLIPFENLYQSNGQYISALELQLLIGNHIKGTPIAYCTGGVRSALLALLIESRLGIKSKSYDGSLWEWSHDSNLPLE